MNILQKPRSLATAFLNDFANSVCSEILIIEVSVVPIEDAGNYASGRRGT